MIAKNLKDLDRILRGEKTRLTDLQDGTVDVSFPGLTSLIVILGVISGACIGVFALFRDPPAWQQLVASSAKIPALFLLTLLITFPSLYVFNALVGSRLRLVALSKLLIASLGVTVSLTAAFGPIVAFFSVSTTSYPFMVLLNVLVYAIAGVMGLYFLLQTLHRITSLDLQGPLSKPEPVYGPFPEGERPAPTRQATGALDRIEGLMLAGHVKTVFRTWVIVFALVGAQMSWVLRPFIGDPNTPFAWFRPRGSNFFAAVFNAFCNLF
ncbi:MAG: hypothetical protein AB8G99_11595 [Planctomycetaceae bacterium]